MDTIQVIKKFSSPPNSVLDIGARDGEISSNLIEEGYNVLAIDIDPKTETVKKGELGDDFGQHDVVIARLLIHQVKRPIQETLNMLWAYVKTGGILYFTNFDVQDKWFRESADIWLDNKTILYHVMEQFNRKQYNGESKDWFVHVYVVKK